MNAREFIECRQDEILEKYYKLYRDSDSGITWYEDEDIDRAYEEAIDEIESELGPIYFIITLDNKFFMKRITNLDSFDKKNVAVIIKNDRVIYNKGYFRIAISN